MASTFGRYQLLRKLGRGGMAEVFLARLGQGPVAKLLAIKRLLPAYCRNTRLVKRLAAEARLTVWLTHPNIVQVFDFGRVDSSYFIAMEYVDGCDLRSMIQPGAEAPIQLPLEVALELGYRLLDALRYAHGCSDASGKPLGIIHRDVSPHNILISRDGHPKLADFGVARAVSSDHQTQPGAVLGKFSYMAPEQAHGAAYDARVDVYAAGATLYQMLTGNKPFADRTLADALKSPLPPPPSSLRPSVPTALDALVLRALAPDPDQRFPTAAAMGDLLLEQMQALGGPPKPHQIARLVEQSLRQLDAARLRTNDSGRHEPRARAELSDIVAGEDSLIGEEVTRVQRHVYPDRETPGGIAPLKTEEDALPPTVALAEQDTAPPLPATTLWPRDDLDPGQRTAAADPPASSPPPPASRQELQHWVHGPHPPLSRAIRLWVVGGLGTAAALIIFGIGLLVGRATVPPGDRVPPPPAAPRPATRGTGTAVLPAPRPAPASPSAHEAPVTPRPAPARTPSVSSRQTADRTPTAPAKRRPRRQGNPGVVATQPPKDPDDFVDEDEDDITSPRPSAAPRAARDADRQLAAQLLQSARTAYIAGLHERALQHARQAHQLAPDSSAAIQLIGAASCYLKRADGARWAHARLSAGKRNLLRTLCARNNIQL